jgi:hypothetical protein
VTQVLGTPEPGKHCLDADRNLYVPAYQVRGQGDCAEPLEVSQGVGRDFFLKRNQEYRSQIDYIGSYFDKINMLFYLTDTSSQFFRVSNLGDNRAFSIGYYRIYQTQLIRLVKDLLFTWLEGGGEKEQSMLFTDRAQMEETDNDDDENPNNDSQIETPLPTQMVSDIFTRGSQFQYLVRPNQQIEARATIQRSAYDQLEEVDELPRIQAPISYNLIWQALVLNSVFNTSTYDGEEDFIEYIAVSELGSGEDRTYENVNRLATFTHPYTQVQYRAVQTIDKESIAFDIVARAQALFEKEWKPAKATLESAPDSPEAQQAFYAIDQKIGRYSDVIADLRLLRSALDFYND